MIHFAALAFSLVCAALVGLLFTTAAKACFTPFPC
jgi:hypothetical protein